TTHLATTMPSDFYVLADPGVDPTTFSVKGGGGPVPLKLACKPSSLGPRSATLTFDTPLSKQPHGSVNLTCYGGGPNIVVVPSPNLAFGKVGYFAGANPPSYVTRKITIMNNGTKPP